MFLNLCRLCLSQQDLIWIFNDKMSDNMKEIIYATSGVEICKTDPITQMVCNTCCQLTIKMYKFRTTSIKNDKDLKTQYADHNVCQFSNASPPCVNQDQAVPLVKSSPQVNPHLARYKFAHPSIKQLVKKYPKIIIPDKCLKSHVGAYITLVTNEVDEWFEAKKLVEEKKTQLTKNDLESTKEYKPQSRKKRNIEAVTAASCAKKMKVDVAEEDVSTLNMKKIANKTETKTINKPETSGAVEKQATESEEIATTPKTTSIHRRKQTFFDVLDVDIEFDQRQSSSAAGVGDKEEQANDESLILKDTKGESEAPAPAGTVDKSTFTEALNLTPSANSTNSPDLSLVSVAKKLYTLYTCRVCDSQQYSAKELRLHMKKTHTKCPFCDKRFKTLDLCKEHVNKCRISSLKMKTAKLELVRVDEIEEMKKKYSYAFETQASGEATDDVICRSDEKAEESLRRKDLHSDRNVKVVDGELLRHIDTHSSDVDVLAKILRKYGNVQMKGVTGVLNLKDNPIKDGSSPRVKILTNLCQHLNQYKIPIEVKYSPFVSVEYKLTEAPPTYKLEDLWQGMTPVDVKPTSTVQNNLRQPRSVKRKKVLLPNNRSGITVNPNKNIFKNRRGKIVQTSVLSTPQDANLMLTTKSVTPTTLVLNSTSNLYTTASTDLAKYAIVLPSNLLPQQSLLPTRHGPLPLIQPVSGVKTTSGQPVATTMANLESITNSLMPASKSTNMYLPINGNTQTVIAVTNVVPPSTSHQPAIRVKSFKDLS